MPIESSPGECLGDVDRGEQDGGGPFDRSGRKGGLVNSNPREAPEQRWALPSPFIYGRAFWKKLCLESLRSSPLRYRSARPASRAPRFSGRWGGCGPSWP